MRRLVLTGFLAFVGMGLFAQSLDKAKDLLKAGKLPDAKAEIDKVLAVDKNQKIADAWYTKMKIYNAIAAGPLTAQYPNARDTAFLSLVKYLPGVFPNWSE
jgi:hypothetical protein